MKNLLIPGIAAIALLCSPPMHAQTVVRETSTTTAEPTEVTGTVTEFAPDNVVIRQKEIAAPVHYSFAQTVEYVDDAGNTVTREVLKTGVPITVRYVKEGDRMIVNRVIVHQAVAVQPQAVTTEKTTTTTTTTEGHHEKHLEKKLEHDQEKVDRDKDKLDKN